MSGRRPGKRRIDVDALRSEISITAIVGRYINLKRRGQDHEGLCPFHNEHTPSFKVNEGKGTYHCFGCGAHGDVISFVMAAENVSFLEAVRSLGAGEFPRVDPAVRRDAVVRDDAERAAKIQDAKLLWSRAVPCAGTAAEVYARHRGIVSPLPRSFRFALTHVWKDYGTGETGPNMPAMVGAVQDVRGDVVGVQCIFLKPDGSGKAAMRGPKRSLGQIAGGALRLGPATSHIIIVEGPEDGLTVAQDVPACSVWVACGTSMMPQMALPDIVTTVTIAGDNNPPGRAAVEATGALLLAKGIDVRTMFPSPGYADFNDELRGVAYGR